MSHQDNYVYICTVNPPTFNECWADPIVDTNRPACRHYLSRKVGVKIGDSDILPEFKCGSCYFCQMKG